VLTSTTSAIRLTVVLSSITSIKHKKVVVLARILRVDDVVASIMTGDQEEDKTTKRASTSSASAVVADVPPVTTRTIVGHCGQASNSTRSGSSVLDWSAQAGLVAYAGGHLVVVADPVTLQIVQTLEAPPPASLVHKVCWSRSPTARHAADRLTLASADASGRVIVWSAKSGEIRTVLTHGDRPAADMRWLDGRFDASGHLLAVLHPPFSLVLWDTASGTQVWKRSYAETLQSFDLDPFDPSR